MYKLPFAIIRLPKCSKYFLIENDKNGSNLYTFNSFNNSKQYKLSYHKLIEIERPEFKNLNFSLRDSEDVKILKKSDYISLVNKTIDNIKNSNALKIVISRNLWLPRLNINPINSFLALCDANPNSFCHLSVWNNDEIWIGSTPEILGYYNNSIFKTMALAGTLPNKNSYHWSEKEIYEQKLVSDYIIQTLKIYCDNISILGPETYGLNHIKHLVTHFSSQIKNDKSIYELINALHPTPAVCGLPLNLSKKFIDENEGYDRDFYAGFIGVEDVNFKQYFVNLRCGKLFSNGALLYVGGGITAQSIPEKEWLETEMKSKIIVDCLL
ncbi:isochorismate synthase [Apibacter muscae]|uniref:isochorismate synthase n=1 Tax=Apibacter muscae TaxID=2509004 RepID=UPI0011AC2351|nr:isochorismate synthase [Apibacter muscae]TWP22792.1 isochorismate synthase [Apibacter muscae]